MTRRGARGWRGRGRAAAAVAVAVGGWLGAGGAAADAVQIDGFWFDNAQVVGFEDGRVLYELAGASRDAELGKLGGVKIVGIEAVEQGEAALAEGNGQDAAALFERAGRDARRPWLQTYLGWRSMQAHEAAGDARAAAAAWLALARDGADPFFLAEPPVEAVGSADDQTKRWLVGELDRLRQPPAGVAEAVAALREAAASDASAAATPAPTDAAAPPTATLVLPSAIDADDPVALLIAAGDYDAAAEAARAQLATSGGLAKHLYLLGRAQLGRAEATGDESAYLDAGLSFMKAAIYFPRGRYTGFALAEAGRVHDAIGRPDKADELYRRAALLIDDQAEPDYAQRLTQFQEALGG
ncbi:MAG: hypothetical protein AAGI54_02710 [Planctomycetota bacterium]